MQSQQAFSTGKFVILVVEDDPLLRIDAADLFQTEGYDVLEAGDADAAIDMLERRSDVAVIFTDVQMPGSMDGLELAVAVKHRWPPIKVIATSGRVIIDESELPEGCRFITKPYTGQQLMVVVEEMMRT